MIRCGQARRRLFASRDARLSLAERLELDEHLASCEACRALDALDACLEEALAELPEPPVEQLDIETLARRIGARIEAVELERAERGARRLRTWRRVSLVAAAAAILLVASLLMVWSLLGRRGQPQGPVSVVQQGPEEPAPLAPTQPEAPIEVAVAVPSDTVPSDTVPSDTAPSDAAPEPSEVSVAPPESSGIELDRLERARSTVREAFVAALDAAIPPEATEGTTLLDARLAATRRPLGALALEGWPVTRLVERVVSDADPEVAALAARWLGRRGDRLSIGSIASLLRRPDVPASLREQAVLALLDDGESGVEALAPALDDAALRAIALEGLVARGDPASVRVVEEALDLGVRDEARADELARALARLGEPGLEALLRAVSLPGAASRAALGQLRRTRGAAERLAALLDERAPARVEDARVAAAAHLGLEEALPLLHERALDRGRRARALEALASFQGPGALGVLLDLWSSGRLSEDDLVVAARAQLELDADRAVELCDELERLTPEARKLASLLDLLLATESRSAAPALARLVASWRLGKDERQWAALALAGLGTEAEARSLTQTLRSLSPDEDRLAAACALAIHAISGAEAVHEALGPAADRRAERLLVLLERRPVDRNQVATLSRASRLLEPWLDPDSPERTRTTP